MTAAESAAQADLRKLAAALEVIRKQSLALHDSLPVSANEDLMLVGEADMDVSTEVRSVIECVLHDMIEPAIRNYLAAAEYRPAVEAANAGEAR